MKETAEKTLFVQFFGGYPIVKVLSFLMEFRAYDYSKKEIAEYSDISLSTLNQFWNRLEEMNIVKVTRKIDKASLYALNRDSPLVNDLIAFSNKLAMAAIPQEETKVIAAQ